MQERKRQYKNQPYTAPPPESYRKMIQERQKLQHPDISRSEEYELARVRNSDRTIGYVLFTSGFRAFPPYMEVLWISSVDHVEAIVLLQSGVPKIDKVQ